NNTKKSIKIRPRQAFYATNGIIG
nr:Chain P, UG29 peptide of Exterior membrane glycoprotein GP120 [synthetic construct]3MLY_P Chain P, HIV-1 gp120 third variable region (V3) crown [Human immunodeficiency virus 1]3MLY_Q Chain Q, HIV-1 gp120 third variable region (V3) crown [Human immunodeficiency virus 1]